MRKILGQEGSFNIVNNRFLNLSPTPVTTPQAVILEYRALDSGTLHPAYRNWIQRYALACAKGILGEIRSKYKSIPSPGGGASLNGTELLQASDKEKAALSEELLKEFEEPPVFTTF